MRGELFPFAPSALPVGSIPAGTAGFWGARSQIHHLVLVPGDSACRLRLGPWFWIHRGCRVRTGLQVRGGGEARDPPFFLISLCTVLGAPLRVYVGVSEPSPSPSIAGTARSCLHTTHLVFLLPRCLGLCPGGGSRVLLVPRSWISSLQHTGAGSSSSLELSFAQQGWR